MPESYHKLKAELQIDAKPKSVFVDELCSDCGSKELIAIENKYWCAKCGKFSDKFQDGDLVGFDF